MSFNRFANQFGNIRPNNPVQFGTTPNVLGGSLGRIVKKGHQSYILSDSHQRRIFDDFNIQDLQGYDQVVQEAKRIYDTVPGGGAYVLGSAVNPTGALKYIKQYSSTYNLSNDDMQMIAQEAGISKALNRTRLNSLHSHICEQVILILLIGHRLRGNVGKLLY